VQTEKAQQLDVVGVKKRYDPIVEQIRCDRRLAAALHIYAALAEKERRMISERTKAALRAAKARGVVLCGMTSKSLEYQRQTRERAEQLRDVFAELGDLSARKAAEALNARGVPTPHRRQEGVRRLHSCRPIGQLQWRWTKPPDTTPGQTSRADAYDFPCAPLDLR
jgi:DNA invertase Pin-like site-specific DNA recombinase